MSAKNERGFVLVTSMLILLVLTILVVNAVRNTTLNEKMAGNYMDRTNALLAAEQALRQGEALLVANGDLCLSGCAVTNGAVAASTTTLNAVPTAWVDTNAATAATASGQKTSGKYQVSRLADTFVPSASTGCTGTTYCRDGCRAYSIMGRGQGFDSRSVVVLQTVAFVCSI